MKLRVLALMAIVGTFALSAYASSMNTLVADDMPNATSSTNDNSPMSGTAAPSSNTMSGNIGSIQNADNMPSANAGSVPSISDSTDDMSADTASGDDDY